MNNRQIAPIEDLPNDLVAVARSDLRSLLALCTDGAQRFEYLERFEGLHNHKKQRSVILALWRKKLQELEKANKKEKRAQPVAKYAAGAAAASTATVAGYGWTSLTAWWAAPSVIAKVAAGKLAADSAAALAAASAISLAPIAIPAAIAGTVVCAGATYYAGKLWWSSGGLTDEYDAAEDALKSMITDLESIHKGE